MHMTRCVVDMHGPALDHKPLPQPWATYILGHALWAAFPCVAFLQWISRSIYLPVAHHAATGLYRPPRRQHLRLTGHAISTNDLTVDTRQTLLFHRPGLLGRSR